MFGILPATKKGDEREGAVCPCVFQQLIVSTYWIDGFTPFATDKLLYQMIDGLRVVVRIRASPRIAINGDQTIKLGCTRWR